MLLPLFLKNLLGNRIAGFIHTINDDVADRAKLEQGPSGLVTGNETIIESILGLKFEISMQSFFQTNPQVLKSFTKKWLIIRLKTMT